MTEDET